MCIGIVLRAEAQEHNPACNNLTDPQRFCLRYLMPCQGFSTAELICDDEKQGFLMMTELTRGTEEQRSAFSFYRQSINTGDLTLTRGFLTQR